jgi:ankyrin repeat protein
VPHDLTPDELAFLRSVFDQARAGDLDGLVASLDAGVPVNLTNSAGDTLLILAAYHLHADLVRALLERGADHARVNDNGQTALAAAVFRQHRGIVADLLGAGADPDLGARSAVAIATFFDLPQMLELLRS